MVAIEQGFETIVRFCILLIELAGIAVIVISMVQGFIGYIHKQEQTRIQLAQGIMLGLEFKIGSEVLRSVIISGWTELARWRPSFCSEACSPCCCIGKLMWRKSVNGNVRSICLPRTLPNRKRKAAPRIFVFT